MKLWIHFDHSFTPPTLIALKRALLCGTMVHFRHKDMDAIKVFINKLEMIRADTFVISGTEFGTDNHVSILIDYKKAPIARVKIKK